MIHSEGGRIPIMVTTGEEEMVKKKGGEGQAATAVQETREEKKETSLVAASGQEVKQLLLQWHQDGKPLDKNEIVRQLQETYPNPISPRTGQPFGEEGWRNGLETAIQDLRAKGLIPPARQGKGTGGNGQKKEPTLGDIRNVNEFLVRKRMTVGDFLDYVEEFKTLLGKVGSLGDLEACAKAIQEFSS